MTDTRSSEGEKEQQRKRLEYRGFWKQVNQKPSEGIQLWASDWNKDYFGFYSWIDKDSYERDTESINALIARLNSPPGDVYIELIDHTPSLEHFFNFLYDLNEYTCWEVLNPRWWKLREEKGDEHFRVFKQHHGDRGTLDDLARFEYSSFADKYEFLETFHPELYKSLHESSALDSFDVKGFVRCESGILWNDDGSVTLIHDE